MQFKYDWSTVYSYWGGRHYAAKVSPHLTLDVWRRNEGNTWEWAVIGNDMTRPDDPLIVKFGTAGTMKEAKFYAESQIKNHPQQLLFEQTFDPLPRSGEHSEVPF